MAERAWRVTHRRDASGVVYHLAGGLWQAPQFTGRFTDAELEERFGPTTAIDVNNVEALLADHARLSRLLEEAHTTIRAFLPPTVFAGPRLRRRTEALDA